MNTNTLIPVFAGEMAGVSVQLVDASLLHSFFAQSGTLISVMLPGK